MIKILKIAYHRSDDFKNRIKITLYPFSTIRFGINTLYRLNYGYFTKRENEILIVDDHDFDHEFSTTYETIDEFIRLQNKELNKELESIDLDWFMYCRKKLLEQYFKRINEKDYFPLDLFFNRINIYGYSSLKHEIRSRKRKIDVNDQPAKAVNKIQNIDFTSYKFQIKLPQNPQTSGGTRMIKAEIDKILSSMMNKHPELNQLLIPLSI